MASETEELESTLEALSVILGDEETFDHVSKKVFKTIDVDGRDLWIRTKTKFVLSAFVWIEKAYAFSVLRISFSRLLCANSSFRLHYLRRQTQY